jgi:hypothetical protein
LAILRSLVLFFVAGIIIYLTFTIGLIGSGLVVGILPLGALGAAGDILGIFLMVCLMGFIGRYVLRYMPN